MGIGNEWLIPLLIILLLFGAKKLPELASSMGRSIKEFRKGAQHADEDADAETAEKSGDAEA